VLIIEDDPESATHVAELLGEHGYRVERGRSGPEALARLREVEPDLIFLDLGPPGAGLDLVDQLRRDPRLRDTPLMVLSAAEDAGVELRAAEPGSLDRITRPFEPRELLARVERQVTVSKVRAALSESEAKFHSVMESAIDAIISASAPGLILAWNRAATALFGFTPDEAIGQPIEIIIPERFRQAHREGMHRVSTGGESRVIGSTVELAAVRKGGVEFPIELSLATWTLDETRYYTGIIRDISERKEAEQKFRSVTDAAIDAIISADREGRIVGWNSAATQILGYTAEEALGQPLEIIIPERFHDAHRDGLGRVATGGPSRDSGSTPRNSPASMRSWSPPRRSSWIRRSRRSSDASLPAFCTR
jgi:PAS domain S-box-containing protein